MVIVIRDGGSDGEIKVMTTFMGIDDNIMKNVVVGHNTSTLLTCRKRIMKHNMRRLMVGSDATILLNIVSSSQLVTHLSVRLVKEFFKNSLIIHEQNTKKIIAVKESLYVTKHT